MQAVVHVAFKKTVLDPQGRTICSTLNNLGHKNVLDVRQGKFFEIEIDPDISQEQAREQIEKVAREVLANPVIEDYSIDWKD
ncbi:MAG: phosphoribosylformylglycinamidine synthase [Solibacterales bacterium]|nr:phosphoribosylformylglycinamidine synthase [Bryobacterales bacterium]|tara:strand:+ start:47454 stop:47699 length:246 start_codon:yes stop_codon:yes gene_type:complete